VQCAAEAGDVPAERPPGAEFPGDAAQVKRSRAVIGVANDGEEALHGRNEVVANYGEYLRKLSMLTSEILRFLSFPLLKRGFDREILRLSLHRKIS